MSDEIKAAESSPAPEPIEVEELSEEQRESWTKTGDLPVREPKAAESAPAKEEKIESEPIKAEAPSKADPDESEADTKFGAGAQKRIKQLLARAKKAEQELLASAAKREEPAPVKEVKAAAADIGKPQEPQRQPYPARPKESEFKTREEYEDQLFAWRDACTSINVKFAAEQKAFKDAAEQFEKDQVALTENLKAGDQRVAEKYGHEGKAIVKDILQKLIDSQTSMPHVHWFLNNTEVLPEMLYALGGKFEFDKFLELGKTNPAKAVRILAAIEHDIIAATEKPKAEEEPAPKGKVVTSALPPPKEIGGKGAAPADEEEAALRKAKDGDPSDYIAIANARDIAKRKKGR